MRLRTALLALPLAALAAAFTPVAATAQTAASSSQGAMSFGDALNAYRAGQGRAALHEDRHLTRAAQAFAEDMARHCYFSHT